MKIFKRILVGLVIVLVVGMLGFVVWAEDTYQPNEVALQALKSDAEVAVTQHDGFITFEPAAQRTTTGFIFYPGGRVDYRAYAPVLHEIAARGYFVALVHVKLNLAFFDVNAADKVVSQFPEIEHWAVGGHSLGGVAAALYAKEHQDVIRAIAFWASYPADDAFKNSNIQILSLHGSEDGVATDGKIEESKALLPAQTQFVTIAGGNHGQFGSYGVQAGDKPATIAPSEQWKQTADATAALLAALVK
jgi:Alpha/beta hydrolase family